MKITVIGICKNEEFFLPFFFRHYLRIADRIVIFDNESTDRSRDIILSNPNTECYTFSTKGKNHEPTMMGLKNNWWKENTKDSDWVIVVDIDELLTGADNKPLRPILEDYMCRGVTFPRVIGFQMCSFERPIDDGDTPITCLLRHGHEEGHWDKRICFDPMSIDPNWQYGCHKCFPKPESAVREQDGQALWLLHYKMLDFEYYFKKITTAHLEQSEENRRGKWGYWRKPEREDFWSSYENRVKNVARTLW